MLAYNTQLRLKPTSNVMQYCQDRHQLRTPSNNEQVKMPNGVSRENHQRPNTKHNTTPNAFHLQRLKDLETPKLPVRLSKAVRVGRHESLTSRGTVVQVPVILHQGAQLPAKVDIHDDRLVLEMARNIAVGIWEICKRRWPL